MVDRKLKGVLVVLSILIVAMFSTVVFSNAVGATDACRTWMNRFECRSPVQLSGYYYSTNSCETACEADTTSGMNCCAYDSSVSRCYVGTSMQTSASSTSWASDCSPVVQCTTGHCCNTVTNLS